MRTRRNSRDGSLLPCRVSLVLLSLFLGVLVATRLARANANEAKPGVSEEVAAFLKACKARDDAEAKSIGDKIFARLTQKHRQNAAFTALLSKMKAAEFLTRQMVQQLRQATNQRMVSIGKNMFPNRKQPVKKSVLSVAPAKRFYDTSVALFSKPVKGIDLSDEERTFFVQYYDLKLRLFTGEIAKAGQALAIAEPAFKGTYDYVLVLPLLHAIGERPINIDVLPLWMRRPDQLDIFSDSALLHYGLPFQAMMVAKKASELRGSAFSELDFYRSASGKCGTGLPHTAADCLKRAITEAVNKKADLVVPLEFDMVQLWLDSDNYGLAAGEARKIYEDSPDHKDAGKAMWLYFYSLSRNNDTDVILKDIDEALKDKRCKIYEPKLLYIKWWALRRKRDSTASVAALEYELLKRYGNDPMVAPIMLSHATDQLASQDYAGAYDSLSQLVEKFPATKAAQQAKRMLAKLKTIRGEK
ncbi:MAG: hypothetical protein JSU94_02580 [Phycisphaerales bacterium]|nr:MAG: hypothetical protein JSU94_02580 [Phycisphaerales bacterium]